MSAVQRPWVPLRVDFRVGLPASYGGVVAWPVRGPPHAQPFRDASDPRGGLSSARSLGYAPAVPFVSRTGSRFGGEAMKPTGWGKRFTLVAAVALVLGACSAAPAGSGAAGGGGTITIGGGFALTGDESALDLPAANGAKLAVKEINAAGGVLGKQINFIVHDSQYKMDVTAQTAKQFVEQDKVPLMIGYTDTDSVLAAGPTFQAAKIPFITVGATSPKIPTQVGDMMFLACFGDNVQAAAGAEFSFKKFGGNAYFL